MAPGSRAPREGTSRPHILVAAVVALALFASAGSTGGRAAALAGSTVRINAGGAAYTTGDGRAFVADANFSGGGTFATAATISGTTDPKLYQDERWGQFGYSIPVTNGTYDVTFHFVELYYTAGSCVGKRIFSVEIADTPASPDIADLDICALAGGANRALVKTISGVAVCSGSALRISTSAVIDYAAIAAIEVVPSATNIC